MIFGTIASTDEAEMLEQDLGRGRGAEAVEADGQAVVADVALPARA